MSVQKRLVPTVLLCLTSFAHAADKQAPTETLEVFGERIRGLDLSQATDSGSRLSLSVFETPASVESLNGDLVRARGDLSIVDAVSRATGITSEATPGDGGTALSTRGFVGHSSVMQLFDGQRMFVGAGTVTFPFDTWSAERIEVLRGPASVLYGQGAIGGVINVVPRRPDESKTGAQAEVSLGERATRHTAFDVTGPIDNTVAYRFDASTNASDNWVDRGDSKSYALSGTLQWRPSEQLLIALSSDFGDQQPMKYFGTPLINGKLDESLRDRNYNVRDSVIHYQDWWTRLKAVWRPTANITFTNQLYTLKTDRHWRNAEEYDWDDSLGLIDRNSYIEIFHHERQEGDQATLSFAQPLAGHKNELVLGFDVNQVRFTHVNNSPFGGDSFLPLHGFDPGEFVNVAGTRPKFHTNTTQYSLFGEDRYVLNDEWSLVGGGRYDSNRLERKNLLNGDTFAKTFSNSSWRAGVVFQPVKSTALYAQYATAVDPVGSLVTLSAASAQFRLSTGKQIEVGIKQSLLNGRAEWTLAAYRIVKHDLLTQDPKSANPDATFQVGEQSSRGLEASVAFNVTDAVRIDANAAALRARFDRFAEDNGVAIVSRAGNTPPQVPERTANLWVSWAFLPQLQARAGLRYEGRRFADNGEELVIPSYTVFDAALDWAVSPQIVAGLRVRNVTDEIYPVAAYTSGQWILGQPRTVEISLRTQF